jgi:hypothetical protein
MDLKLVQESGLEVLGDGVRSSPDADVLVAAAARASASAASSPPVTK